MGGGRLRRRGFAVALLASGCAGPGRAELAAHAVEARQLASARAVFMPPAGTESCVGVTLRLSSGTPAEEAERAAFAGRFAEAEVEGAVRGLSRCVAEYEVARAAGSLSAEPVTLRFGYGVDGEGRVCAVVEPARGALVEPALGPLLDEAARCASEALWASRFPAGRLSGKERAVLIETLRLGGDRTDGVR
jgi:hypothetical protein